MPSWLTEDMLNFVKIITALITVALVMLIAVKLCEARRHFQFKDLFTFMLGNNDKLDKGDVQIIPVQPVNHHPQQQQIIPVPIPIPVPSFQNHRPPTPILGHQFLPHPGQLHHPFIIHQPLGIPIKHVPVPVPIPEPYPVHIEKTKIKEIPILIPVHQSSNQDLQSASSFAHELLYDDLLGQDWYTKDWSSKWQAEYKRRGNNEIDDDAESTFSLTEESAKDRVIETTQLTAEETKFSLDGKPVAERMTQSNDTISNKNDLDIGNNNGTAINLGRNNNNKNKNNNNITSDDIEMMEMLTADEGWGYKDLDLWYVAKRK